MSERIKGIIHVCLMLSAAMLLDTFLSVSPLRFDLTEDGKNTLSDTTTSLLSARHRNHRNPCVFSK